MKFLFDANLSPRLVSKLQDLFPDSLHLSQTEMPEGTPDRIIWGYARRHEYTIVTADDDFSVLSNREGSPPKVIWLQRCDYPTRVAAELIRRNAVRIREFETSERGLLVLKYKS